MIEGLARRDDAGRTQQDPLAFLAARADAGRVSRVPHATESNGVPASVQDLRDPRQTMAGDDRLVDRITAQDARGANADRGTVHSNGPARGEEEARALFSVQQAGEAKMRDGEEVGLDGLTESERREVERLKARDREVREHEQAHVAAGGPYVSAPSFRFVRGPDGQFYAVGGEVRIDTSPIPGNPQATIRKMQIVKRAALAPREPSAQDRRVAAQAEAQMMRARQQIAEAERAEAAKAAEKRAAELDERTGRTGRMTRPGDEPVFDPEARFRHAVGGIGAMPTAGLAGSGGMDLAIIGTLDSGALFNLVA